MNRGIPLIDVQHYLNTNLDDILPPQTITNLVEGVSLLLNHVNKNHKILLQVDSDCDGFTSFAVFMNYLNNIIPSYVQNNIIYQTHNGKHHGIEIDRIPEDIKLVVALDASSNEYKIHSELKEKGIDVLVIDHHKADQYSSDACVINNQLCDYPTKSLSGVGMVYKFCSYIDILLNTSYANQYLDLVALGLCADMMDIRDFETKELITLGFNNVRNPFIKKMMEKNEYNIKGELTPMTVGFYIAPYINAIARIGTQEETLLLAEAMLEYRSYEQIPSTKRGCKGQMEQRVEQACRTASNVRNRQNKLRDASSDFVDELIKENNLLQNKILFIQVPKDKQLNYNITGLIGNQTSAKYQRPVLILNEEIKDDGIYWMGSGRGLENSELNDFRKFLLETNLVEFAEGHENAFGVSVKDSNLKELIKITNERLENINFDNIYKVDFIYENGLIENNSILTIASYNNLWGNSLKRPKIAIKNIPVSEDNFQVMKGPTIKITTNGLELLKFKASEEEINLFEENQEVIITIVGECDINTWGGQTTPQILVDDYNIEKCIKWKW